jgi:glyoxalase family protein
MQMQLTGIHHLTAISAKPRQNLAFYTGLLGMRLVKARTRATGRHFRP